MHWNTWMIVGLILLIIGLAVLIIGIIVFEVFAQQNRLRPWWIWALMVGGTVVAIIGFVFLTWGFAQTGKSSQPIVLRADNV